MHARYRGNVTTTTTRWVTELQDALGADSVLLDPDVTAAYARDQAMLAPAGTPAAVVLPRSTADVVAVMQVASRARGAGGAARRRIGAGRRQQRRRRRHHAGHDPDGRRPRGRAGRPARRRPAGRGEQGAAGRRRRLRAVLSAGPLQLRLVHDRRQPRPELRRPVLRQVRRHHRLRARPGGGPRRRAGAAHRPAHGQGRRRLRPGAAVRRLGGHARRDHRGDPGPAARRRSGRSRWPPTFATTAQAGQVVERVVTGGLVPSLLEIMDQTCIRAVDDAAEGRPRPRRARAAASPSPTPAARPRRPRRSPSSTRLCEEAGADFVHSTDDPAEGDLLLAARRMALPALQQVGGAMLIDDVAVPAVADRRLPRRLRRHRRAAASVVIGVVGHAGDGNMHPTVVLRRRPTPTSATGRTARSTTSSNSACPWAARSPASTASATSRSTGWSARSARSPSTCTARSRTPSTRPGCSTPARCSAAPARATWRRSPPGGWLSLPGACHGAAG